MEHFVTFSVHLTVFACVLMRSEPSSDITFLQSIEDKFCNYVKNCALNNHGDEVVPVDSNQTNIVIPILSPPYPGYRCCKTECSCDAQACGIYDTCCLDTLENLPTVKESSAMVKMTCYTPHARTNFTSMNLAKAPMSWKMFQKCPSDYSNTTVIQACEIQSDKKTFQTETPVTDTLTSYSYRNRFCAICNNVSDDRFRQWAVLLKCTNEAFKPKDIANIFEEILQTETCNIIYEDKGIEKFVGVKCDKVISSCNETGNWKIYNPFIERACLAYTSVYDYQYKNVYCYMCNTADLQGKDTCYDIPGVRVDVSFAALLHVPSDEENVEIRSQTTDKCRIGEIYDEYKKVCRVLICLFPKTLRNGTCMYMMDTLGGVRYKIFFKLSTNGTVEDSIKASADIMQALYSKVYSTEPVGDVSIRVYTFAEKLSSTNFPDVSNHLKSLETSDMSTELPNESKTHFIVCLELQTNIVELMETKTIDRFLKYDKTYLVTSGDVTSTGGILYDVELDVFKFTNDSKMRLFDPKTLSMYDQVETVFFKDRTAAPYWSAYEEIPITPLYECTLISLNSTEFDTEKNIFGVFLKELNTTLTEVDVLIAETKDKTENFEFRMCTDKYKSTIEPYIQVERVKVTSFGKDADISIKGVVSVVCTVISMFLLVVTVVTYAVYKDLRSQPGVNNIILCGSVFVAQGLFQFGVGQSENVSEMVCKVLGILIHFSWLFVLFWMNVCCIQMVRVFRRTVAMAAKSVSMKLTTVYLIYSACGCCVFVALNILISIFGPTDKNTIDSNYIGYGGKLCYISENQMIGYCFVLPVGVIVLINISMYIIVIRAIRGKSGLNSEQQVSSTVERNYFQIYTRLSTLTGGTWLFGFIYLIWQIDAIEYIFISLNASQGTLLFLSFVCNKRNLNLYKESFSKFQSSLTSSTN